MNENKAWNYLAIIYLKRHLLILASLPSLLAVHLRETCWISWPSPGSPGPVLPIFRLSLIQMVHSN